MKRHGKAPVIIATVIILLAMAAGGAYYTYCYYRDMPVFLDGTTLNGEDISGRTPAQVADKIDAAYRDMDAPVIVCEGSEDVLDGMLSQFGYTFVREPLEKQLEDAFAQQHSDLSHIWHALREGDEISFETAFTCDEEVLREKVRVDALSVPRTGTVDPSIAFDEEAQRYYVEPGKRGDEIDEIRLQELVKSTLDEAMRQDTLPSYISVSLTEDVYCSPEPADTVDELEAECLSKNKEIVRETWKDMSVTYTFGSESEILDYDVFSDWLMIDDKFNVTVDRDKAAAWLADLGARYDTRYLERTFTSTTGRTITFSPGQNEYGYTVLEDQELPLLVDELLAKEPGACVPDGK